MVRSGMVWRVAVRIGRVVCGTQGQVLAWRGEAGRGGGKVIHPPFIDR